MSAGSNASQSAVLSAVRRALGSGRVWTIQGVGTLLFLTLAYVWLWIQEAKWWELAGSVLLALFLAYLAVFLQRTALRVYRRERIGGLGAGASGGKSRRLPVRQWLPGAVLVLAMYVGLVWLSGVILAELPEATQHVASWLTLHLRRPVDPFLLQARVESAEFAGVWFLFVVIWLPFAAASLLGEHRLWTTAVRAWRRPGYWIGTLVCTVVGQVVFWKLAEWVPQVKGIAAQSASLLARLSLGYVIALGAWLVILALVEESISNRAPRSPDDTWD